MDNFIGREPELAALNRMLRRVADGGRTGRPGKAMLIRGRRRVGKSRLVEEFIERSGLPSVFFTASQQSNPEADLRMFVETAAASDLPGAATLIGQSPRDWDAALRLLVAALPDDRPSAVVLDEMPYLIKNDAGFEGTLQKLFDRELSRKPVLLLCVGSDLAMMERLNDYDRPFHQRGTEMVVPALSPADVAEMLQLPPADAFDAFLVSGGLPLVLEEWPRGAGVFDYLAEVVEDPTSALLVSGERSLAAEFPADAQARLVLGAIGSGERTRTLIGRAAGDLPHQPQPFAPTAHRQAGGGGHHPAVDPPLQGDPLLRRRPAPALLARSARTVHVRDRTRPGRPDVRAHPADVDLVARPGDRTRGA